MFFIIGENEEKSPAFGHGETLERAIDAWASQDDYDREFITWKPTVIEGHRREVVFTYTVK
jgi:hypothetical protein